MVVTEIATVPALMRVATQRASILARDLELSARGSPPASSTQIVATAQPQGGSTMDQVNKVIDELRTRIARLEREVQSRDSYLDGLILRHRSLRIEMYKHQAEVIRLRRVLREAGLTDAARESATRLAVATASLGQDFEPPTEREPGKPPASRGKP